MKTTILLFTFISQIFLTNISFSIDTNSIKYFPLHVGNVYVYSVTTLSSSYRLKAVILRDTIVNNHRYYYNLNLPSLGDLWLRVDSITGNLMRYGANCPYYFNEYVIDSFAAGWGGFYGNSCLNQFTIDDTSYIQLFGIQSQEKRFHRFSGPGRVYDRTYTKFFGLYRFLETGPIQTDNYYLQGCIINGVLYGDTNTFTGINNNTGQYPNKFALYQNYPNPFNPNTMISFDIKSNGFVKLAVYDILGQEISILVNEQLGAGKYSVNFDASKLTSGIYVYNLKVNDFSESRKMMIIK